MVGIRAGKQLQWSIFSGSSCSDYLAEVLFYAVSMNAYCLVYLFCMVIDVQTGA